MAAERRLTLLALALVLAAHALRPVRGLRCEVDEHCGQGGLCDQRLGCCRVRGCPLGCPPGQACQPGRTYCGKFAKLVDTCACPRKLGCMWIPERREPREPRDWLDMFYDAQ